MISSALQVPSTANSFDTVVSTEVLEHVPDLLQAMREMQRALKPGGFLILSTPIYWPRHEVPYDLFRCPSDGILHLVKESGLQLTELLNRGRSYVFLGQARQHVHPVAARLVNWLINQFFLCRDCRPKHDVLTMGWTVVAQNLEPPGTSWDIRSGV